MGKPLRVLMVEDSEDDVLLTIRALKKGGYDPVYERVETAEAMHMALSGKTWDVILCDYNLPGFSGLKATTLLKERDIDLPLIIISGAIKIHAQAGYDIRPTLGIDSALEEIEKNRGTLYDTGAVDACLRLFREKRYKLE
jgi:CheY-like chemotaxis protein